MGGELRGGIVLVVPIQMRGLGEGFQRWKMTSRHEEINNCVVRFDSKGSQVV